MWKTLDIDSTCLGIKVAEIEGGEGLSDSALEAALGVCREKEISLVVHRSDGEIRPFLNKDCWYTAGVHAHSATFVKEVPDRQMVFCKNNNVQRLNKIQLNAIRPYLFDLAIISGEFSRFNVDPALTRAQFRKLYGAWVDNIIANGDDDYVFVAFDPEEPKSVVGFLSLEILDSSVKVGLFAVAPRMQRKGLGTQLMNHAFSIAQNLNCTKLHVTTQRENVLAYSFYKKYGFSLVSEVKVIHFWLLVTTSIIRHNVPYFTGQEVQYISDMLKSNFIESSGESTRICEQWIQKVMNCPSVLLTGSATAALEQAAILCDIGPGDEVIMPSYTFVSTANAFCLRGAVPVFVDIDKNCQLCLSEVEKAISPRTKAVVAVHYAGQCCEVDTLADICNRHGIFLIEDAAQAFLSTYKGRYLGTFGDFGCFSFHYTKNTICGEGGALLINQEIFVKRAHVVQEQGTNRFDFINNRVSKYEWVDIGSSYVSNELSATFLVAQLQDAWYCSRRRRCVVRIYQLFLEPLLDNGHIKRMIREIKNVSCNGHLFWFVLHEKDLPGFQNFMESKGIVCYSHYEPLHVSPAGLKYSKTASICMENTVQTAKNLLRLPVWVGMTHIDVFRVLSSVLEYFSDFEISLASVKEEFDRKMRDEHSGR